MDAEGTVFDAENGMGMDLLGVAVAEGACADAGRGDSRHHGTAGQDLFRHVAEVEAFSEAVSEEHEAELNHCHHRAC